MARSNAWSSNRNVSGEEIWYGRFEAITSNGGQSTFNASPVITSTSGRGRRRYSAKRRSGPVATARLGCFAGGRGREPRPGPPPQATAGGWIFAVAALL